MKRLTKSLRYFFLALQFFTRIPVTGRLGEWADYSPEALRKSAAYFPAIGWIIGVITAPVSYTHLTLPTILLV